MIDEAHFETVLLVIASDRTGRNGRLAADTTPAPAPSHTERGQRVRLPAQRGWLLKILGWEVALYSNLLEQMLAEPDMQALIAARPGLGRWLRPLCRMLHVSAPVIARAPVVKPETLARRMERRRARRAALWPTHVLPVLAKGAWFAPPIKNSG